MVLSDHFVTEESIGSVVSSSILFVSLSSGNSMGVASGNTLYGRSVLSVASSSASLSVGLFSNGESECSLVVCQTIPAFDASSNISEAFSIVVTDPVASNNADEFAHFTLISSLSVLATISLPPVVTPVCHCFQLTLTVTAITLGRDIAVLSICMITFWVPQGVTLWLMFWCW